MRFAKGVSWIFAVLSVFLIGSIRGQSLSDLSGDAIVSVMQTLSDKCPTAAPNGQTWAPLPADSPCGSVKRCDFPNQWCAFKMGADGNPDLGSLNCQALSADCKKAFQDAAAGASGGTAATDAPGGTTPGAAGGDTSGTSTPGGFEGTSPAASGSEGTTPGGGDTGGTTVGGDTGSTSAPGGEGSTAPGGDTGSTPAAGVSGETTVAGGETTAASPGGSETPPAPTEVPGSMPTEATPGASETPAPAGGATGGTSPPPSGECCDYHEFCCFWASTGQCETNKPFMTQICKKSCSACSCSGDPAQCTVSAAAECAGSNVLPGPACPCKAGDLVHKDWNPKCGQWAARGDCDKNTDYMKPMCKASCNICK